MGQRLVRRLCEHCKVIDNAINPTLAKMLGFSLEEIQGGKIHAAVGCEKCYEGYSGRVSIMEAMPFTETIRQIILKSRDAIDESSLREEAIQHGMVTLRGSGRGRVLEGLTTLTEIASATTE